MRIAAFGPVGGVQGYVRGVSSALALLVGGGCVGELAIDARGSDLGPATATAPIDGGPGASDLPPAMTLTPDAAQPLPPGDAPPPVSAPFFRAVSFENAIDFGHDPQRVAAASHRPPGETRLQDVTTAAGLGGAVGGGNQHGVGVAFLDLDGDDLPEIFVANGRQNHGGTTYPCLLYRNRGDGTFEDVSERAGITAALAGVDAYSVAAGDYDADGDVDLYLGAQPHDVLLQNSGDGTFRDGTAAAMAGGPASDPALVADGRSKVVSLGDYDGDGWIDIASASSTLPNPGAYLLRNRGDGTFADVTATSAIRIHPTGNPCAMMFSDFDTDGDADLWIWNDRGGHVLLRNDGGHFAEATADGVSIDNPMGIDAADLDHDLDLDYYVSNIGAHPLLQNNGDGTFTNITDFSGTRGDYGWGLGLEDLNADTWVDIFVAQEDNRAHYLFTNRGEDPLWFDESRVEHPSVENEGAAHNVAVAFADYDRDGRVDVVTAGTDGRPISLYRNVTDLGTGTFLEIKVARRPSTGERGGIGGRVAVSAAGLVQFKDLLGGSSRASQNEISARFGLGDVDGADWVAVLWPSGEQLTAVRVPANRTLMLGAP